MRTAKTNRIAAAARYTRSVNLAVDHVVTHLDQPSSLRLSEVSRAAGISPFHFHRVFQAMMGETIADFVKRLRLSKALSLMAYSRKMSLTSIAMTCGFASASDFSRAFKQRFGVAPSAFDLSSWRNDHRAELEDRIPAAAERHHLGAAHPPGPAGEDNPDGFAVKIRELGARTVAYIRVLDPYQGDGVARATERLLGWADAQSLSNGQWLGYQWDNPEIAPLGECQYHVAVEVPLSTRVPARSEISLFRFPAMSVAQVEIRGGIELELRALRWLYGVWLPQSRYLPDDHPVFEAWVGRPFAHGMSHFELNAQLPVRLA